VRSSASTLATVAAAIIALGAGGVGCSASATAGIAYHRTYLDAPHNWAFRDRYPAADRLFNAFDYGHAILSETLWRRPGAPTAVLDVEQFDFITTRLLPAPPRLPLEESAIAPEWAKLAPEALEMFGWAHMLHRQLYDVWADERVPEGRKDAEVAAVLRYYLARPDLAFSTRPKDMHLMEGQSYSTTFRRRYPKFNGLIWSYHWLQMSLYDALLAGATRAERDANVDLVLGRFWGMVRGGADSLPRVMPMSPAIAPRFTARYPEAAAVFENLHAMHDVVSDILADPAVPRSDKRRRILDALAVYRDDSTAVTTADEWRSMADDMGVDGMGGVAFPLAVPLR
jgi:hypothetical protein